MRAEETIVAPNFRMAVQKLLRSSCKAPLRVYSNNFEAL